MSELHILIIPPWFDKDYSHLFAKSYHRWAGDLAAMEVDTGLLYGEFGTGIRNRRFYENGDLDYHYLGVTDWGLPKTGPGWYLWENHYLRAFEEYVLRHGQPTVIHGFSLLGVIAAGAIHRKYRIPFVYTEVLGSFISGRVARRLVRKAAEPVRIASTVCGISPDMITALTETFQVRAELIPLYVDGEVFSPGPVVQGSPHFVSIGSPAGTKGLDILVAAMRYIVDQFPDSRLTMVDEIPEKRWLESMIRKYQLERHISFTGAIPHHQVPPIIHQSHVLVSASREESLGFTMIEALLCGRPVVATSTPGSRYIIQEGMGVIVPQEDPEMLANAMMRVYRERSYYDPASLHENAHRRFGKQKILQEWMKIYREVSSGNGQT